MSGIKYDGTKPDYSMLELDALEGVVRVLMYGEQKYARSNWKQVKPARRYFSALLRHIALYQGGQQFDEETKLSHLAHIATNAMFLLWMEKHKGFVPDSLNEPAVPQEPKQSDPQPTLQSPLKQFLWSAQPQSKAQDYSSTTSAEFPQWLDWPPPTDPLEMIAEFDSAAQDWKIFYDEKTARERKIPAPVPSRKARAASKPRRSRRKAR